MCAVRWRRCGARRMARKTAMQTDTGIVIVRDGKPVIISAQQLCEGKE